MVHQLSVLYTFSEVLLARLRAARDDDRGMTTETVIITAALAAAALLAVGIIYNVVKGEAESIPTGGAGVGG